MHHWRMYISDLTVLEYDNDEFGPVLRDHKDLFVKDLMP